MIEVKGITKRFGTRAAVDDVSFELPKGESVVIVGPSGAGKTTLLRLIAGLDIPDEGEIHIGGTLAGKPGWSMEPHLRGLGYVFQSPALWPHMTIAQNILFGLEDMPKVDAQKRLAELIDGMQLHGLENRYPDQVSSGEARRVSIARTLAPKPGRILMDEPLTNVDPELKEVLMGLILDWVGETKASLLYVTHIEDEAERISDRGLRMREGRLVE